MAVSHPVPHPVRLQRDGLTWAAYAWVCGWAFYVYSLGAVLVFLIEGQQISRSVAGLHLLSQAVGTLAAGLVSQHLVRWTARRGAMVVSATLIVVGLGMLAAGAPTWLTVTATLVTGMGGSLGQISVNLVLADHHGAAGPAAIAEVNALAVGGGVTAPLMIGATSALSWGWQPPLVLAAVGAGGGALYLARGIGPEPSLDVRTPPRTGRRVALPPGVPVLLLLTVLAVAVEFSCTSWTIDLMRQRLAITDQAATLAGSALLLGMATSRAYASRLALRLPVARILAGSLVLSLLGWVVLWTAGTGPQAAVGLVVTGLGIGAGFPLSLALTIGAAGRQGDRALAQLSLWMGLSVGAAPFVLGALADLTSLHTAFTVVPVLVVLALVALSVGSNHR